MCCPETSVIKLPFYAEQNPKRLQLSFYIPAEAQYHVFATTCDLMPRFVPVLLFILRIRHFYYEIFVTAICLQNLGVGVVCVGGGKGD